MALPELYGIYRNSETGTSVMLGTRLARFRMGTTLYLYPISFFKQEKFGRIQYDLRQVARILYG